MPPNNQNFFPGYMSSKAIGSISTTPHATTPTLKTSKISSDFLSNRSTYGVATVKKLPISKSSSKAKLNSQDNSKRDKS